MGARWFGTRPSNPPSETDTIDVLLMTRRGLPMKDLPLSHCGVVERLLESGLLKERKKKQAIRATADGIAYLERFAWAR
jgi:hypothetical protein